MNSKQVLLLKQAVLFIATCFVLVVYFNIGVYSRLYHGKLAVFKDEVKGEWEHMSLQGRMYYRFGEAYQFSQYVKYYVDSPKVDNPLILLPPPEYLKAFHYEDAIVEPIVYYYFTGYKCVTTQSADVYDANYAIFLKGGNLAISRLMGKRDVGEVLEFYKTRP